MSAPPAPAIPRPPVSAAASIGTLVLAANTPLPLLTLYQSEWGFSTATLTVIYGAYTVGVVAAVFTVGPRSDTVGRRAILAPALAVMAVAMVVSALAASVWMLVVARVLQGVAVGAGTTTAVAMLGDGAATADARARAALTATLAVVIGLAGGPLVAGALAEFAPAPTLVPYVVAAALVLGSLAAVAMSPETVAVRASVGGRSRLSVPPAIRASFWRATYVEAVAYAVAGTFAGLGGAFARDLLGLASHFVAGLAVAMLFVSSALGQYLGRRRSAERAMRLGLALLAGGLAVFGAALLVRSAAAFFAAATVLGVGHGLAYLGSQELVDRLAPPAARAGVLSAFQLGLYAGATLPALVVGAAARLVGFGPATAGFTIAVFVGALVGRAWVGAPLRDESTPAGPRVAS
jgi:MFS family permease